MTTLFVFQLHIQVCICLSAIGLIAEANSCFLHIRKLMQMFRFERDGVAYRSAVYINLIAFVVFRFLSNAVVMYHYIFSIFTRVSLMFLLISGTTLSFGIIYNIKLFGSLIKRDILQFSNVRKID